jgi:DNA (cytosine-5)-methyltransferase 1
MSNIRFGSVCSGIEAASAAWHPLGWEPVFFSEIEAFPRAVLEHHYPDVPLHGDFTTIGENDYGSIDLLVGGTPCQSFSIAGLRGGMDDDRGNLALEFIRLAQRKRSQWVVWENVPGVLSSNGGRDFGSFLGALAEIGYGFAYRVLDAQYFGVAQRRRRVFVVGYLGDWRHAAAVLFERESVSGNPAPSREKKQDATTVATSRTEVYECHGQDSRVKPLGETCSTVTAKYGTGGGNVPIVTFSGNKESPVAGTLETTCHEYSRSDSFNMAVASNLSVRRLTPTECERLQGFPDGFTKIPYRNKPADKCPDGPRYKALGNSMAVPVMRWIGERIQKTITREEA